MKVSGELQDPATICLGIRHSLHIELEFGGAPKLVQMFWRREIPCVPAGNQTTNLVSSSLWPSHYTDYNISAFLINHLN
jgi:hypothetical protein